MSEAGTLPRAAQLFVSFATLLRRHGFLVVPEQVVAFLAAIDLLGPSGVADIRRAAHATLGPAPERRMEFDALFDEHFLGKATKVEVVATKEEEEGVRIREGDRGRFDPTLDDDQTRQSGQQAATAEMLAARRLGADSDAEILRRFERALPERLPRRRGYRKYVDRRGPTPDLRRSLREAVRNDGEVMRLPKLRRHTRQRRVLLLIDVSGSMKERTEAHLRFAHALAQSTQRIEIFTVGTRLTRVTKALALKRREQALAAASALVADWDGGTRIGNALQAFLAVPRFAGYARGALVLIVSDGFERGDHRAMTDAVARIKSLAWRISWLTPLLADPRYRPATGALKSILPLIDDLSDASSIDRLCAHVLALSKAATARASAPARVSAASRRA